MIGSCDNCDRQNVPVFKGQFCGCDTTQCYLCQGDTDPDPYGEIEPLSVAIFIPIIAEALAVTMFIAVGFVWLAIWSGA